MREEKIGTAQALQLALDNGIKVTRPTIHSWCLRYKLGYQLGGDGGRWVIYKKRFEEFVNGKKDQEPTTS